MSAHIGTGVEPNDRLARRKKRGLLPVVIMGAGRLGESLLTLGSFSVSGFTIVGVFDKDPQRIGIRFVSPTSGTHVVEPTVKLASRVHSLKVKRGIIAVPPATAQEAADELVQAGINVILSYSPADLRLPSNVIFSRMDPATQFARMVQPSPVHFPWRTAADPSKTMRSSGSSQHTTVGLARLPSMWTSFVEGDRSIAFNPVLLTLVSPVIAVDGEESDIDRDEETSTVTSTSIAEDEIAETPGFFEFIQSNQRFFVTQQKGPVKPSFVGLEQQIESLKESLLLTDDFVRTRGILLYGPSGCGKSTLIKHMATCLRSVTFIFVSGEDDSLLAAFKAAAKAATSTSVVVIENLDVVCRKRSFKSTFLSCTDNPSFTSVAILATSNAPWDIDMCVLRHFERRTQVPLPDTSMRAEVLRMHFQGCTIADRLTHTDFVQVAKELEGYSTCDVITVAKNAGLRALKCGENLGRSDLLHSANVIRPTFCRELIPLFASFTERFGTETRKLREHNFDKATYLSMYS